MDARQRLAAFWLVCLPARLLIGVGFTVGSLLRDDAAFYALGGYAVLTALGFAANGAATAVGAKTRGGLGGAVWWRRARLVHAAVWVTCGALLLARVRGAGALLLVDALLGALFGALHFHFGLDV